MCKLEAPRKWFETTHSATATLQIPLGGHARILGRGWWQGHSETALREILTLNPLPPLPSPANNVSPPAADALCALPPYQM